MSKLRLSVLITTKNRARLLMACLTSLSRQTLKPDEVVVVDNGSTDHTKSVIANFRKRLPIRYFFEPRSGIPFGRNLGIKHAKGVICAFIDDDCQAKINWIKTIADFFQSNKNAVGVVGKTKNSLPSNVYSCVEHSYYLRWVKENIIDLNQSQLIHNGAFIDFKNAAFRTAFIKNFRFSTNTPFGDVGDEDVELGVRLLKKNKGIFFIPGISVRHQYSTTLSRLLTRNYWSGYSNQRLFYQHHIKPSGHSTSIIDVLASTTNTLSSGKKALLYAVVFVYPIIYRLGKIYAVFSSSTIPQRL